MYCPCCAFDGRKCGSCRMAGSFFGVLGMVLGAAFCVGGAVSGSLLIAEAGRIYGAACLVYWWDDHRWRPTP